MTRDDIRAIVAEVLDQYRQYEYRIGYPEAEAAAAMGIPRHRLRDARLRGEITARRVGRGYVYSRESLLRFLESD